MFSILKKPQNTINADDLEQLQNEIERHLVNNVKQRWRLERLLDSANNVSPEIASQPATATSFDHSIPKATISSSQPTTSLPSGKLRNSMKLSHIETQLDDATDGFRGSIFSTNNNGNGVASGPNSNETDSISSESSLTSILTSSTIITANLADSQQQSAGTKRGLKNSTSDRPSKRFRQNSSNSLPLGVAFPKRPPHSKHRSKIVPSKFRNSAEESRPDKKQVLKNEAPDKLWPFVEQFCITPTEEQMRELEEMLKSMDNDKEYYRLPVSVKKESPNTPTKNDGNNSNHSTSNKNQRKSKSKNEEDSSLGALTQRLVSSFIEEVEDNGADISKSSSDASSPPAKKRKSKASKGLDADNAKTLEKRIRQQLEECSILSQQDDIPFTSEEDETLRELLACQHELLSIQTQNKHAMQALLKRAKRHTELEAERLQLMEANSDVFAAYYRLIQAKQRKRNPTKKEKEAAYKAIKVHETIFKKCDELYITGMGRSSIT